MSPTTPNSAYLMGVRDGAPFILVVVPFAMLFGVVAIEAGLRLGETLAMSVLVIAGASQFAALQLMIEDATVTLVLLAALTVNLRMAMYSAALVPHLGAAPFWQRACAAYLLFDQTYAVSVARFETDGADWPTPFKMAYYFGVATPIAPLWALATLAGALLGARAVETVQLDFVLPLMFLALVAPMLKSLAHVTAAGVSVALALALSGLPAGLGLLIAAAVAMMAGALVETWLETRR